MNSDFNRGNQLKREGKLDEAIAAYQRAIELNPSFSWSHHNLGEALATTGQFEKAVSAYQRALEINPLSACSHQNLGEVLTEMNRLDEAIACFQRAIELSPDIPQFQKRLELAKSQLKKNNLNQVTEDLGSVLISKMLRYSVHNLKNISIKDFRCHIKNQIGVIDASAEGFQANEIDQQRDLSLKFHWGHNHDFGEFKLEGKMGDRHIKLMKNFCQFFPVSIKDFQGKYVLDIGCWTGGTTLLLNSLGSRVLALEEVNKYAKMTAFLVQSFALEDTIEVVERSLYQWNYKDYYNKFDIIYFPGVIYHLTDPVLALRILYNCCKIGGFILVESMGIDRKEPYLHFQGTKITSSGTKEELNRSGWNYFIPSPSALQRMLEQVGYEEVKTLLFENRLYGYAEKKSQVGITKAGLSVFDID